MPQTPNKRQKDIQLEDLLQLKRLERPAEEYWGQFDRELHQRMLRALVKKDPWYLQVMRGLSGRLGQSVALVGAGAAVFAVVLVRPGFVESPAGSFALLDAAVLVSGDLEALPDPVAVALEVPVVVDASVLDFSYAYATSHASGADYGIDEFLVTVDAADAAFERDFEMDRMQVVSSEGSSYSGDSVQASLAFASVDGSGLVF